MRFQVATLLFIFARRLQSVDGNVRVRDADSVSMSCVNNRFENSFVKGMKLAGPSPILYPLPVGICFAQLRLCLCYSAPVVRSLCHPECTLA